MFRDSHISDRVARLCWPADLAELWPTVTKLWPGRRIPKNPQISTPCARPSKERYPEVGPPDTRYALLLKKRSGERRFAAGVGETCPNS